MNPGGGDCSEPRWCHYTPPWVTQSISKKKKKEREKETYWLMVLEDGKSIIKVPTSHEDLLVVSSRGGSLEGKRE